MTNDHLIIRFIDLKMVAFSGGQEPENDFKVNSANLIIDFSTLS